MVLGNFILPHWKSLWIPFFQVSSFILQSTEEFRCQCNGKYCNGFPVEPSEKLIRLADKVRGEAGRPMVPTSTVRCRAHNKAVGGVENSRHLLGKAMDFSIPGWSADRTLALVRQQKAARYAYAIDGTHVHMDIA